MLKGWGWVARHQDVKGGGGFARSNRRKGGGGGGWGWDVGLKMSCDPSRHDGVQEDYSEGRFRMECKERRGGGEKRRDELKRGGLFAADVRVLVALRVLGDDAELETGLVRPG